MDEANEIFTKIKTLGASNNKREELREYCKLNILKVVSYLPRRILKSDGGVLIKCIFDGVSENRTYETKVKIIDKILQTLRKESFSLTHCGDMVGRVCLELPRLPLSELVRWSSDSVQSILDDCDVNMIWRDILPECLNAISSHDNVKHSGTDMTGMEFKNQCVNTLCQCQWTERQLVQLVAMFNDMHLSLPDHKKVVNKICSYIIQIPPETLPPLVHQLLKLCKIYNVEIVLSHLSHYFISKLYSKLEPPPYDSESTTMEFEEIAEHSSVELSRCLSTCLYHVSQGVADRQLIRKYLKQWPKSQLLRAPFLIDLALALSDKGSDFRFVCLDVVKSALEFRILDELQSKESAWVRHVLPPEAKISDVLKVLTTESANHCQITVMGLINLAFSLLSVSRIKPTAPICWSYGKLILVRLCKSQPETAGHILSQLGDRLSGDCTQRQYSDCLYVLCKLSPSSIERCTQLSTILENCQPLDGYAHAAHTYAAVRPLISFSTRVRDTLVMVCRKGLYSRDSAYRCLALSGFLTVLKQLKLSQSTLSSQDNKSDQYSATTYFTQLTVEMHSTSQGVPITSRARIETICLEIVTTLRRCLVQDAVVKQLFYTEIYNCVMDKPALHETVLELLYEQLFKYLPDEDDTEPLVLSKCIQTTDANTILTEPIGRLLYVIALFLQPVEEEDIFGGPSESSRTFLQNKLIEVLDKLCDSDLSTLVNMETGLTLLTLNSQRRNLNLQQVMQCLEALIAHRMIQWSPQKSNATNVYNLYKCYNQLVENIKSSPKAGKKSKDLNGTRDATISQKSQESQKTQKRKGKGPVKISNLLKDRIVPFKPLPCLWDLPLCLRILELLYSEDVPWSSIEERNQVRSKSDFHAFALQNIHSAFVERADKQSVSTHVLRACTLLYKRCLCRFQDLRDFDDNTTLGCLELFKACLTLLFSPSYSLKIESVLSGITNTIDDTASSCLSKILQTIYAALAGLETESSRDGLDIVGKKIVSMLVQIVTLLLEIPVLACDKLNGVIINLDEYVRKNKQQESLPLLEPLLTVEHREQQEAPLLEAVLSKLMFVLGPIEDEESETTQESSEFPTVDSNRGHAVLKIVCEHLNSRFKCAGHLLDRARDLSTALNNAVEPDEKRIERELKLLYKSFVIQMLQLVTWTSTAASMRFSIGVGSDKVISACVRLYTLLASLFKQLDSTTAQCLNVDPLLKFAGKELPSVIRDMITYVVDSQEHQKSKNVLRETKLIPRLVLRIHQFSRNVLVLDPSKDKFISLETVRDFRLKTPLIEELLSKAPPPEDNEDDEVEFNDAATEVIPITGDENENEESDSSVDELPPKKRKRVS